MQGAKNKIQLPRARMLMQDKVSPHVETVVLLSGEKVDGHIDIDLDVEKLKGKSGTATYAEIKAYIKENAIMDAFRHFGLI